MIQLMLKASRGLVLFSLLPVGFRFIYQSNRGLMLIKTKIIKKPQIDHLIELVGRLYLFFFLNLAEADQVSR